METGDEQDGRAQWTRWAEELEVGQPRLGMFPIPGLLRQARRKADLSQRQLAARARVAASTVGKIESGAMTPSLDMFARLLEAAGLSLVVVDGLGRIVQPMRESEDLRDGGGRRYPAHLDVILDPEPGEWWADDFGMTRPPETFYRDRSRRDALRWRAIWQVRVSKYRGYPEPPDPDAAALRRAARERREQDWREGLRPEVEDYPESYWDDID